MDSVSITLTRRNVVGHWVCFSRAEVKLGHSTRMRMDPEMLRLWDQLSHSSF